MGAPLPTRIPVSTYRLQLSGAFTLFDAAAVIPYLAELGITECYCSPILASRPGSSHGYDVTDHSRVDPELGGEEGLGALVAAVREYGLGLVVDFVPNHMSADATANAWWRSVLENGPSSPFATYFDVDWDPVYAELKQKLLLPILGEPYGKTLESGALQLELGDDGIRLRYYDHTLPLNPRQLQLLLAHDLERLAREVGPEAPELTEFRSVLFHLEHLPWYADTNPERMVDRLREKEVALDRLADAVRRWPRIRRHVEDNVRHFNGHAGDPRSFDQLHELLEVQPYRLAFWRTAVHEINYRRFFDVNELVGLRPEDPAVFTAMHELTGRLIRTGAVTGIRLDHIDGLFDPAGYLRALQETCAGTQPYVVVEKILSHGERLSPDWLVHGTTGYDFLNEVLGLFIDPDAARRVIRDHDRFVGNADSLRDVACDAKRLIIATSMASELNVLATELNRVSEGNRHWRDFTFDSLQEALREVVACFPVYRTYVSGSGWSPFDERCVSQAIQEALRRNPALEPTIFSFIRQMLLPSREAGLSEADFRRRVRFAMKFQQYTGPVQAKGVEDTAFYRHAPLLALNEVGGEPEAPGVSVAEFHERNRRRHGDWPLTMLTTATHDTKRGEDARARLAVLSEMPERWRAAVVRWHRLNAAARAEGATAPDPAVESFYYQTLLGAWPPGQRDPGPGFVDRLRDCTRKAMREAKVHTSWINPSEAYEDDALRFVEATLSAPAHAPFRRSLATFANRVAQLGMLNALAQVVLKVAAPGVPDFYQGTEVWDLNLVDPDNRRPVDFIHRREALREFAAFLDDPQPSDDRAALLQRLLARWPDGRIKLFVTAVALHVRRRLADTFLSGEYLPVAAAGTSAGHVVSFIRRRSPWRVLVVAPRLVAGLVRPDRPVPIGPATWGDTALVLADEDARVAWQNVLTGERVTLQAESVRMPVASALSTFPVGLFVAGPDGPAAPLTAPQPSKR